VFSVCLWVAPCHGLYPTSPPLTKGRDDSREVPRKPGNVPHGKNTHKPFSSKPLRKAFD